MNNIYIYILKLRIILLYSLIIYILKNNFFNFIIYDIKALT